MTLQYSDDVANGRLHSVETTIGTGAVLKLRSGAQPANTAAADSGTVVATLILSSDWMAAAAARAKAKAGTWQDLSADASATIAHFRIYRSNGTTCDLQGSVTLTGLGGDMTLDAVAVTAGQAVTITGFTMLEPAP